MKSTFEFEGGVTSTPPLAKLARSAAVNSPPGPEPVTVAVRPSSERVTVKPLSVPAATTAPAGMPAMVTDVIASEPSTSMSWVAMFRPTVVSSRVDAADTERSGASVTAATATARATGPVVVGVATPVSGSVSVAVELT